MSKSKSLPKQYSLNLNRCHCVENKTQCKDLFGKGCVLAYGKWCRRAHIPWTAECLTPGMCPRDPNCAD